MRPALVIDIPAGHVAHWKQTEQGYEIELLRFLSRKDAKASQSSSFNNINHRASS